MSLKKFAKDVQDLGKEIARKVKSATDKDSQKEFFKLEAESKVIDREVGELWNQIEAVAKTLEKAARDLSTAALDIKMPLKDVHEAHKELVGLEKEYDKVAKKYDSLSKKMEKLQ